MHEQIVHRADVFREQTHEDLLENAPVNTWIRPGDPRSPVLFASGVTGRGPGSRLGPYNLRANGSPRETNAGSGSMFLGRRRTPVANVPPIRRQSAEHVGARTRRPTFLPAFALRRLLLVVGVSPRLV